MTLPSGNKLAAYAVMLGALVVVLSRRVASQVPADELGRLVNYWASWFGLDPRMVRAIVEIESGGNAAAVRPEPQINDASIGLMQTLLSTAQWLSEIGYSTLPKPTYDALLDASTSLYFGCAYLHWLARRPQASSEEWIVRAYNGGPGGADRAATLPYWRKYLVAKGGGSSTEILT